MLFKFCRVYFTIIRSAYAGSDWLLPHGLMGSGSSSAVSAGEADCSNMLSGVTMPPDKEHRVFSSYREKQKGLGLATKCRRLERHTVYLVIYLCVCVILTPLVIYFGILFAKEELTSACGLLYCVGKIKKGGGLRKEENDYRRGVGSNKLLEIYNHCCQM